MCVASAGPLREVVWLNEAGESTVLSLHPPNVSHDHNCPAFPSPPRLPGLSPLAPFLELSQWLPCVPGPSTLSHHPLGAPIGQSVMVSCQLRKGSLAHRWRCWEMGRCQLLEWGVPSTFLGLCVFICKTGIALAPTLRVAGR